MEGRGAAERELGPCEELRPGEEICRRKKLGHDTQSWGVSLPNIGNTYKPTSAEYIPPRCSSASEAADEPLHGCLSEQYDWAKVRSVRCE